MNNPIVTKSIFEGCYQSPQVHRIAVTGATGFIGRSLVAQLVRVNGAKVLALTRENPTVLVSGATYINLGDLTLEDKWQTVLAEVSTVIHTAARAHVLNEHNSNPLQEFRRVNTTVTLRLAERAAAMGVERFVFLSSIGVNGVQTNPGQSFSEANKPNPHNAYAISKWEAEEGLMELARKTNMKVVIIRPPLVYGAKAPGNFGTLMLAVRNGWPMPLGAIKNLRSLIALDNLINFIITASTHPKATNQTFLVSDGQDLSTTELVRGMAKAAGMPARLVHVPAWALQTGATLLRKGDTVQRLCSNLQVDISKARNLLCWEPPVSVEEGLKRAMTL